MCLQSTSDSGRRSNIVSRLSSVVTVCRTDIDIVVTEHGAADLSDKPTEQRAEALIALAAPEFRDRLKDQWNDARQT